MAKLFIWGYNHIRSTRRLEKECTRNTELMWLLNGLRPDHTSISRFRATHAKRIATWLKEFNLIASAVGLLGGKKLVIDGTLLKAVNAKKNNYTSIKISRTLAKIQKNIDDYLERLKKSERSGCDEDRVNVDDLKQKLNASRSSEGAIIELTAFDNQGIAELDRKSFSDTKAALKGCQRVLKSEIYADLSPESTFATVCHKRSYFREKVAG